VNASRAERPRPQGARAAIQILASPLALAAIVVLAGSLRLAVYLADRSLIVDESFMALNVARRSATGLTGQLDWNSAAPIAFLEIEKGLTALFGGSDFVLRLAPLGASLIAVFLFVELAKRVLESYSVAVAALLFAGVALATAYAAIAKPYSFDLALVIGIYLATLAVLRRDDKNWPILVLAGLGIVGPLFSFASVFAIAASATVLVLDAAVHHNRAKRLRTAVVVCSWLLLLGVTFLVRSSTLSHIRQSLSNENRDSFTSARNAGGALRQVLGVSQYTNDLGAGLAFAAAAAAALLISVGIVSLFRVAWERTLLLTLPAVFLMIASAAGWYPLFPRAMLFLAPSLVLLLAAGCTVLLKSGRSAVVRGSALALLALVVVSQGASTARTLQSFRPDYGLKPIMNTMAERQRPGDSVYLNFAAQYAFAHYLECDCAGSRVERVKRAGLWPVDPAKGGVAQWSPALRSRSSRFRIGDFRGYDLSGMMQDLAALPRGRVWVILAGPDAKQRRTLVAQLDRRGKRIWARSNDDVAAVSGYLYDF
jgi:Dolichyl-phosphate-mannose-protein mannosyltransferase